MKNRLLFICFSLIPSLLFAQQATMPSVQLGAGIGQIFKHTTNFKPPVRGITVLTEATYEWQTAGAAAWHTTHRYPVVGLTLSYADFGDNEIFGQAIGIFPSLSFSNRWKQKRFYSFLRIGFGIAYLTKPYNEISNPLNNVIGSHWEKSAAAPTLIPLVVVR